MNLMNDEALHDAILKKAMPKLLAVIVNRSDGERTEKLMQRLHLPFLLSCMAEGTAGAGLADLMGLGPSGSKTLIFCIAPGGRAMLALNELKTCLRLERPGRGIAFTVPLSGLALPENLPVDEERRLSIRKKMEESVENMSENSNHDLILAVINHGFSETLMEHAQAAGVTGGTVLNARHLVAEATAKLFDIPVDPEREIVAILVPRDAKELTITQISSFYREYPKSHGALITLPVDHVVGLHTKP